MWNSIYWDFILIVSRGFKYERHYVTTEDGYMLQLSHTDLW
uniref:Partial AB-hydrolase lipase domain-containing protein n=1 Tax=Tetranychus urticae TaxID=32264 RepID=T1KPI1_TETUR